MTSENKPSDFIGEFVSGGPKNYAYKTVRAATSERKITLNYSTSQLYNFEVITDKVLGGTKMRHVTVPTEKKLNIKGSR